MTDEAHPKHARQQGADALKITNDADDPNVFTALDCPYGPGELRDAWLAGFKAEKEEVRQADTSNATTQDVRTDAPVKTVRRGASGRARASGSKRGGGKPKIKTDVETRPTGTAETALETHVATDPNAGSGEGVDAKLGDPAGTDGDKTTISKSDVM